MFHSKNAQADYWLNIHVTGAIQEKSSPATAQMLSPSVRATPQSSEHLEPAQPGEINDTTKESEAVNAEGANEVPAEGVDLLDKFLPPPPKEKCPEDLQVSFFCICCQ